MSVPYESTGRRNQKSRTREALVAATRTLLAQGGMPTVEEAAGAAAISRTTAYRYFPNQRALLAAVHPEIEADSLLTEPAPADPRLRLEAVMRAHVRIIREWEPELRTSLRLSLDSDPAEPTPLRRGRAIDWIEQALTPLLETRPDIDIRRLAMEIRSATGIESFVWLTDVARLSKDDALETLCRTAQAVLAYALADSG
ncbi:TetR/AcrR family transcriptional regulator [Nocardia arizonensis]|uniref:TetR/AcrR family transcriptional regulator n=1 Tax=Nocardia arizonensis TaxID=1141647 RepID=UPI0006D0456C|nr:TetR/AcrR family transcriptional regulator [Nocardia arizonensis]